MVAWPDGSVYSLGNFNSRLVWSPKSRVLVEEGRMMAVRCMDTVDGFFLTGSFDNVPAPSLYLALDMVESTNLRWYLDCSAIH